MQVSLRNIFKDFNGHQVLREISFDLVDGELVSLLGPSGCGKTTTLNLIAGILSPSQGQIFFDGEDITQRRPEDRQIGMIFQTYALYPHMTVRANIEFPLKMAKLGKEEKEKRIASMLSILDIGDLLDRKPSQLSGGQQQRVAIARALVKQPRLLLMDEPFSNLDKKLRVKMRSEIRNLQQQLGITTIFVTHDQEEASSISDRIILMQEGHIIQQGTPQALYYDPNSLFTARFIGDATINEVDATYEAGMLHLPSGEHIAFRPRAERSQGPVRVGFRPEALHLVAEEEGPLYEIVGSEVLGKDQLVQARRQGRTLQFFLPSNQTLKRGDQCALRLDEEKVLVFDPETDQRILPEEVGA